MGSPSERDNRLAQLLADKLDAGAAWERLRDIPSGTLLWDEQQGDARFIVMRGPASLCAYVGVPSDHPLSHRNYDDVELECHGGLTWGKEGKGYHPEGWYWYGWDYGHAGDACLWDSETLARLGSMLHDGGHQWTLPDVLRDAQPTWEAWQRAVRRVNMGVKVEKA